MDRSIMIEDKHSSDKHRGRSDTTLAINTGPSCVTSRTILSLVRPIFYKLIQFRSAGWPSPVSDAYPLPRIWSLEVPSSPSYIAGLVACILSIDDSKIKSVFKEGVPFRYIDHEPFLVY